MYVTATTLPKFDAVIGGAVGVRLMGVHHRLKPAAIAEYSQPGCKVW